MKKFSRILALLMIVLMLATMSVSCKKQDDDEEAVIAGDVENGDSDDDNGKEDSKDNGKEDSKDNGKEDSKDNGKEDSKDNGKEDSKDNGKEDSKDNGKEDSKDNGKEDSKDNGKQEAAYEKDETGKVTETIDDDKVGEDFVLNETITNDNGFIPDEEQGLEKSERFATEASKYNFDQNPLINRDRKQNKEGMPSFDIDDTGFVRSGTKIKDLRGKTLTFFTADNFAAWSYRNERGETINEWQWFKDLRKDIGLNVKYTVKQHQASITAAMQEMNAGKPLDIIYTNHNIQPQALCISRSITSFVNINNLGSSPGVCKKTMDLCKWGNTLRLIAPIGVVDLLWYNQTLTQELGLSDPHTMWEKGAWDLNAFKKYLISAPKTTKDGSELVAWTGWTSNLPFTFDKSSGKPIIEIVADAKVPTVKNNWLDADILSAYETLADINKSVNFKNTTEVNGVTVEHLGLYQGTTLMSMTMYTQVYRDTEYSKNIQINWVPIPKATTKNGKDSCQYYGFGMVLPRKTSNEKNVDIALKFMELWATRFTETYFDNLNTFEYYNFNYMQRKQYFDFVTQNVAFTPSFAGRPWYKSRVGAEPGVALGGNAAVNVRTEMEKCVNTAAAVIEDMLKFGN